MKGVKATDKTNLYIEQNFITKDNIMANDNPQRKVNEEVRDNDKDIFMEVRGIIDGCIDSGSTDYTNALSQIARVIDGDTGIIKDSM